jgi:hypothetical protein
MSLVATATTVTDISDFIMTPTAPFTFTSALVVLSNLISVDSVKFVVTSITAIFTNPNTGVTDVITLNGNSILKSNNTSVIKNGDTKTQTNTVTCSVKSQSKLLTS